MAATAGETALLITPLAGCGSDHPPAAAAARTTPPVTAAPVLTTDAVPLSQAELGKAVITAQDVPGFKVDYVQRPGSAFLPGIPTDRMPPVFPAACTPVYWSTQAASTYPPTARIDAIAHTTGTPEQFGNVVLTYRITQNVAGDDLDPEPLTVPMTFTVIRVGTTVTTFWNQGDATQTTPPVIAPQLIPAQTTKLTTATHTPS